MMQNPNSSVTREAQSSHKINELDQKVIFPVTNSPTLDEKRKDEPFPSFTASVLTCHRLHLSRARLLGNSWKQEKKKTSASSLPAFSMASTGLAWAVWGQDYIQVLKLDANPG